MLNIKQSNNNEVKLIFNTKDGVKQETIKVKPLRIKIGKKDSFTNMIDNKNYSITNVGTKYAYTSLYNKKNRRLNHYLNTVLQLKELMGEDFIDDLEPPKLVFYDIETNEYAIPKKDNENKPYIDEKARINSIAWIDEQGKEDILVKDVDGSEKEILQRFLKYLEDNNVMGLVGHNSFGFDNKVCEKRIKALEIGNKYINVFYNQCNMDTMKLASFLQFTTNNNRNISLNNLSKLLKLNNSKTELGDHNPITLYTEAIKEYENNNNNDKLELFKEYNLQDVRLTKACFEAMNSLNSCIDIFKQTLCRFNMLHSNQELLNSYVCNVCYNDYKIVIPKFTDTEIGFENDGGYNYYNKENNKELQVYNNVVCFDIVSYYPNLLRLIQADTTNPYKNINRETGDIKEFKNLTNGLLGRISGELYKSRISIKQEMNNHKEDSEEYNKLNREQKVKKIIVNSLYGALSVKKHKKSYFILKNKLISATITKMGREILKDIRKEFNGVYAKTDSVFIELGNNDKEDLLKELNKCLNIFIKSTYNLDNVKDDGEQLIRFEIDKEIDKLFIKDKNNYCWFENNKLKYKGGNFNKTTYSEFENDLIEKIIYLKNENKSDKEVRNTIIQYTCNLFENNKHNIKYFSQQQKLTDKTVNKKLLMAKEFLTNHNYNFIPNHYYNYCCIENEQYTYILYNDNHKFQEDTVIKKEYCLKLAIDVLKNIKIINNDTKNSLYKQYKIDKFNKSIKSSTVDKNQTVLTSNYENNNKLISFDKTENEKLLELKELIHDTVEYYDKGYLRFIRGFSNKKGFNVPKGFKYTTENINKELTIDKIKPKDNIGVITGYKGLSCLDIDGAKGILTDKKNQELKKYLLEILKDTGYPFIIQETVSKGFHLFYYDDKPVKFDFSHIYYPENFDIEDLRGKSLSTGTIEVFNTSIKPIMLAPSSLKDKENYRLLEDNYKWSQIFNNKTEDIYTIIEEQFKKHGFKVGERKQQQTKQYNNYENNKKAKELNDTEITKVSKACNELMKLTDKENGKYDLTMALAGVFSKYCPITEDSLLKIKENIVSETGKLMENTNQFEKTLIDCYYKDREDKYGFKKIKELLTNEDNNIVNKYISSIKENCRNKNNRNTETHNNNNNNSEKEEYNSNKDNRNTETDNNINDSEKEEYSRNEKEIYGEAYTSYAEYSKYIPYVISEEFLKCFTEVLEDYHKEHKDHIYEPTNPNDNNLMLNNNPLVLNFWELLNGGLYHMGLKDEDIIEILTYLKDNPKFKGDSNLKEILTSLKDKPKLYHVFKDGQVFGFNPDGNEEIKEHIIKLKNILKKATRLNTYYYNVSEKLTRKGFKQRDNKLYNDKGCILNCAFVEITKLKQVGQLNENNIIKTMYNFKIRFHNKKIVTLEHYTINDLEKYLKMNNLILGSPTLNMNNVKDFINYVENKGDIKEKETSYLEGFTLKRSKKGWKLLYRFPDLNNKHEFTIEDGVTELNKIYEEVFDKHKGFPLAVKWFLIHTCRHVWSKLGVMDPISHIFWQYGKGGTGKSKKVEICNYFFSNKHLDAGSEADSVPAVNRMLSRTTIPLMIDDPAFKNTEIYQLIKKSAKSNTASNKASDQYGNDVTKREAVRQLAFATNDKPVFADGVDRRIWLLQYTEADIIPDIQERLFKHLNKHKGYAEVEKLIKIGEVFIEYLYKFIQNLDDKKLFELIKDKGETFIKNFFHYINSISTVKINQNFIDEPYIFEELESNFRFVFYEKFLFMLKNRMNIKLKNYDINEIEEIASNISYIHVQQNQKTKAKNVYIQWRGLKEFVESKACLNFEITSKRFIEMLEIENNNFTNQRLKGKQEINILKLSIPDFYKYFINYQNQNDNFVDYNDN